MGEPTGQRLCVSGVHVATAKAIQEAWLGEGPIGSVLCWELVRMRVRVGEGKGHSACWAHVQQDCIRLGKPGPSRLGLAWVCIGLKMGLKNGFKNYMGLGSNQNNNNKKYNKVE